MSFLQFKIRALKPRNSAWQVLASKKNAGGAMRNKKQEQKRGVEKHRSSNETW